MKRISRNTQAMTTNKPAKRGRKPRRNRGRTLKHGITVQFDREHGHEYIKNIRRSLKLNQLDFSKLIGGSNQSVISRLESKSYNPDCRTYSMILLVSGYHPNYKLVKKKNAESNMIYYFAPSPSVIASMRRNIRVGTHYMTQNVMAKLLGLNDKSIVSLYENGGRMPSQYNWTLFLLATSLHPNYAVVKRPKSAAALKAAKTTKKVEAIKARGQEELFINELIASAIGSEVTATEFTHEFWDTFNVEAEAQSQDTDQESHA